VDCLCYNHSMEKVEHILLRDGIGVLPTDTIYGVVGSAFSKKAVERIYKLRKRNLKKPMIILIGSFADLDLFDVKVTLKTKKLLQRLWPGKVSAILPCTEKKFSYLHRGTNTLAFRFPKKNDLVRLLRKTGPLVAPSANPEGFSPAKTIQEAKKYFGNEVDFDVNEGTLNSKPSKLVELKHGELVVKRK
jgi:L-threonylcarbamoyladenylate synthase